MFGAAISAYYATARFQAKLRVAPHVRTDSSSSRAVPCSIRGLEPLPVSIVIQGSRPESSPSSGMSDQEQTALKAFCNAFKLSRAIKTFDQLADGRALMEVNLLSPSLVR